MLTGHQWHIIGQEARSTNMFTVPVLYLTSNIKTLPVSSV